MALALALQALGPWRGTSDGDVDSRNLTVAVDVGVVNLHPPTSKVLIGVLYSEQGTSLAALARVEAGTSNSWFQGSKVPSVKMRKGPGYLSSPAPPQLGPLDVVYHFL